MKAKATIKKEIAKLNKIIEDHSKSPTVRAITQDYADALLWVIGKDGYCSPSSFDK